MSNTGVKLDLSGTSAVVTGSTRGIGATIAKKLNAAGASVVVSGRTENEGNDVVEEIEAEGGNAVFCQVDVRKPDSVKNLIKTAHEQHGGLDILVNNAAFETDTSPETISASSTLNC